MSKNYYDSIACMNEMGAAWALQSKYTIILLPGFEFREIEGAINPRQIGLKFDNDIDEIKEKLRQLKGVFSQEFGLAEIPNIRWERKRDEFIISVTQVKTTPILHISDDALTLLLAACNDDGGTIIMTSDLSGTHIEVNGQEFITSQKQREIARWDGCLQELLDVGFVQARGSKTSNLCCFRKWIYIH